jgi:hypothetical protein
MQQSSACTCVRLFVHRQFRSENHPTTSVHTAKHELGAWWAQTKHLSKRQLIPTHTLLYTAAVPPVLLLLLLLLLLTAKPSCLADICLADRLRGALLAVA